jgi:hypothetical protein
MTRAPRILAVLAVAAISATIALAPTTSDARDGSAHKRPDIGARHGHRTVR